MNPIVGGAIVSGVGSIAGGALSGKAAKEAAKMQLQSNREALAFSREQEATRKANYDRAYGIWDASRQELMRRYGIALPASTAPTMAAPGAAQPTLTRDAVRDFRASSSPAEFIHGARRLAGGAGLEAMQPAGRSLGQIAQPPPEPQGEWNDWRRYGLRS